MKALKITLSVLVLLVLILVIAIVSASFLIDPNRLKPILINEVAKKTDYNLAIDGALTWSFYPLLGVHVEHMTLSAPKQTTPFLDLNDVTVATKLADLLQSKDKVSGELRIASVNLGKLHLEKAAVDLHWENQVVTLSPIKAQLYDGYFTGVAHGAALSSTTPKWDWDVVIDQVQIKPLLEDVNGADSKVKLSGVGRVALKASAQGSSKQAIFATLNGLGSVDVQHGSVEGVDLNYFVQTADALINKQPINPPASIGETVFDSLNGNIVIKNGVVGTNDLLLQAPSLKAIAAGEINLNYSTMNLALNVSPQNVKTEWEIPVLIIGDIARPDVRLDMTEVNKFLVKQNLEKVKDKISKEIEKVPGEAGKFLKKLLGN
ncbi:MAG: AsmA family protein [Gammaproteobacteria bacterium]